MRKLSILFVLLLCTISCKKDVIENSMSTTNSESIIAEQDNDGEFLLGEKLENPYSIKNMETALKELQKINSRFEKIKLVSTHQYVRIEAETDSAFVEIQKESNIDLFRTPLDYEIKKAGKTFTEKDYIGQYQVFWAAVPIDYSFGNGLKVKVIEELYLPKGTRIDPVSNVHRDPLLDALEDKSLTLFDKKYNKGGKTKRITGNIVSGKVSVWDNYKTTFLPIIGVTVRAKRWFTTVFTQTNGAGDYTIPYEFNGSADLTLLWNHLDFQLNIQNGTATYASYVAGESTVSNISGFYNFQIAAFFTGPAFPIHISVDSWRLATCFRAAFDYYYKHPQTYNISGPPKSGDAALDKFGVSNTKLNMGIRNTQAPIVGFSHTWMTPSFQGGNHIVFSFIPQSTYTSANKSNFTSLDIYGTTIHEMSHAKHFKFGLSRNSYLGNKLKATLAESYAVAMEYRILMDEYNIKNTSVSHAVIQPNREYDYRILQYKTTNYFNGWIGTIPFDFTSAYTPFFIDLMDTYNQAQTSSVGVFPNENVNSVSMYSIEQAVKNNPESWSSATSSLTGSNVSVAAKIAELSTIYSAGK